MKRMNEKESKKLVDNVANFFKESCTKILKDKLESFYFVGSYALNKISLDRPDINFLLVFKEKPNAEDFLNLGDICRETVKNFKNDCLVRIEFRPFRYIYPKFKKDFEIFINPIIMNMKDKDSDTPFNYPKYFLEGIKSSRKIIFGNDVLKDIEIVLTKRDFFPAAIFDLIMFESQLSRAPAQFDENEFDLLFNESVVCGKFAAILGVEIAMNEEELKQKEFLKYIHDKEEMIEFYKNRYDENTANNVKFILEARLNYLKYKDDKEKTKKLFRNALEIIDRVKLRLFTEK